MAEAPSLGQLLGKPWKLTPRMGCQPFSKVVGCYTDSRKSQNRGGEHLAVEHNLIQLLRNPAKDKAM